MSSRALRKLNGGKDDISSLATNLQLDEENDEIDHSCGSHKKKAANLFDLVNFLVYFSNIDHLTILCYFYQVE